MNEVAPLFFLTKATQACWANQLANTTIHKLSTPSDSSSLPQEVRRRLCPHKVTVQLHNSQTWS